MFNKLRRLWRDIKRIRINIRLIELPKQPKQWIASAPYVELPPLPDNSLFVLRISKNNISMFRVPRTMK
jgi:hypothetical protein